MDPKIKEELSDEIQQLNIKKEEEDVYKFVNMTIQALKCKALTEMQANVTVNSVDADGISVSGDGITHTFPRGPRIYEVKALQSKTRVILKNMVKQEFDFDGEPADQYRFDLVLEFARGGGENSDYHSFMELLRGAGYN